MSKKTLPSKFSLWLIRKLCKPELSEELEGNLLEYYEHLDTQKLKGLKYWYQVLNYLRPSTLKSFKNSNSGSMFIFNPIVTFRNLYRHKSTTVISIAGFTFGLVATIFLYFHIYAELSYDTNHADGDQIYRVIRQSEINGTPYNIGVTSGPFSAALINDFPSSITSSTRALTETGLVSYNDQQFYEDRMIFADANFFEFFSFPLATGDPSSVLRDVNSAVMSKELATKYFGDENPIGKQITIDNEYQYIVSGIIDDLPAKSHIPFDLVLSIKLFDQFDWFKNWWSNSLMTYVKIPTPAIAANVGDQLPDFMTKYFGDDFERSGTRIELALEPLHEVYFNNETRYDPALHGSMQSLYILVIVAIAILFIACFNYVNLSIAQSFLRAKEVGVRKVMGVPKNRLVFQFLGESMLILIISISIAILLCELINPVFYSYFDLAIELNWLDANVILFFGALIITILLTSGVYPAMMLSSFKAISAMKGSMKAGKNVGLRKGLVVTQFAISIFLIVATILISIQTDFLKSKDLGFDKEAVVVVRLYNSEIRSKKETFIKQLQAHTNIKAVSNMSGEPGGFHDVSVFQFNGIEGDFKFRTVFSDTAYSSVLNLEIVAGRDFSHTLITDQNDGMLVNEKAIADMGVAAEDVIGKKVKLPSWNNLSSTVIGVVKDFHFNSLHDDIEPLAIVAGDNFGGRVVIKTNSINLNQTLIEIDEIYRGLAPGFPIEYDFLDESLARLYEQEQKQAKIFSAFSGVSIFLACLGIFGLAAYSAQRRQKELGIRKVLGATAKQIIGLISKEFVLLVLIASFIAIPSSWYFISKWLGAFAYRISIPQYWFVFALGGLFTIIIALITVTLKTYKAAISDPTESIRSE